MTKNRLCCCKCGGFFGYEALTEGEIQLYCRTCKSWTTLRVVKKESSDDANQQNSKNVEIVDKDK